MLPLNETVMPSKERVLMELKYKELKGVSLVLGVWPEASSMAFVYRHLKKILLVNIG